MTSKAFAFLNDLGFNYSLCSHVVFSDSSCLHPVNELSGSNNPVEAFLSVHWVAGLGHLCQKLMALICTREDGCPVQSLGRIHGASLAIFSLPLLLFMAFFFLSLCFNPYLSKSCFFFFPPSLLFGNRFASVCTEAVSGVMDRAGSHPRSISVPN